MSAMESEVQKLEHDQPNFDHNMHKVCIFIVQVKRGDEIIKKFKMNLIKNRLIMVIRLLKQFWLQCFNDMLDLTQTHTNNYNSWWNKLSSSFLSACSFFIYGKFFLMKAKWHQHYLLEIFINPGAQPVLNVIVLFQITCF